MLEHHATLSPSSFPMMERCPCYTSGEAGEAAESGNRQHALLALMLTDGAAIPEDKCGCDETEVGQVEWACAYIQHRTSANREIEKRLSLIGDNFEEITFGTLDVVDVASRATGDTLLVMDYKSGEDHNYLAQMAVYARMAMITYGKQRCEIHEVYGRKKFANSYTLNFKDTDFIFDIISSVQSEEKKPAMNEFCAWCEKHGTCKAATEPIVQVATEYEPENAVAAIPFATITNWHSSQITDPNQMSMVLQIAEHVGKWADAVKADARKAALAGMEIPGYYLKQGGGKRIIPDLNLAFEVSGLSVKDFLECCSGAIGKLEKAMAKKQGHKSHTSKAAKDDFKAVLGEYIAFDEHQPTLAKA